MLERRWPPYHDGLAGMLPELERRQGWERGSLGGALSRLLTTGEPRFQQELERRVEELLASRGVDHEWGGDLDQLQLLPFQKSTSQRQR